MENFNHIYILTYEWFIECCLNPLMQTDTSFIYILFISCSVLRDIIIYSHMKWRWNRTMLNLCGIVVTILKMATGRNLSMSGINSGHHYLPTYKILMISDNAQIQHCSISTSWIDSRHQKISNDLHFQWSLFDGKLYIIYRLLLLYFRFSNPDIKTEHEMNNI
jgi:hypothetical protein